ncbi:MAG: GNAT family N-acetyltransferase [Clostridia bacterium]|nr:GNAT family N-acetyltransferase [Clostridia bacterium]
MKIESERLRLSPVSDDAMRRLIESEPDAELKQAYAEMLDGCLRDPANRDWYAVWLITLKTRPGTAVGDLSFKGPPANGAVELGYGLRAGCCGNGYMTEAVRAVCAWAFAQPGVARIEAETDPGNRASQRVLAACGFAPMGVTGEEGPRFALESRKTD